MSLSTSSRCTGFTSYNSLTKSVLFFLASMVSFSVFSQSPHSVVFTGASSDFNISERYAASANDVDYYATYDATNLYIGAFRTSGNFGSSDNLALYFDTDPTIGLTTGTGTTVAQSYNGVSGTLPFTANYNVHAEEFYQEARSFGGSWSTTISGLTYYSTSTCREVAIPLTSIGSPYALYMSCWIGNTGTIYGNAPGASLGNGSNPVVVDYFGGIGLRAADCTPLSTTNSPMIDVLVDTNPTSGLNIGSMIINSGSFAVTNDFSIAPGGSIEINGGTLNLANTTINFGGNSIATGKGALIQISGGNIVTGASSTFNINGEVQVAGNASSFGNTWVVNNKLTLQPSGGTTISGGGQMDLRNGGFLNGNAPTYGSGSMLSYNTGSTFVASSEWASGSASDVGVPFHVQIGNQIANSKLSFGSSSSYRRAAGNVNIDSNANSELILSTVAGGDLQIGGNFDNDYFFTHNNRSVTFNGANAQTIDGNFDATGVNNNFHSLIISTTNTAGVSMNSSVRITGASGNVLSMTSIGRLNLAGSASLTFVNDGGNILVSGGARTIRSTASGSVFISSSKTISSTSGGTLNFTTTTSGLVILSDAVDFGNNITTIGNAVSLLLSSGSSVINNAPNYATGSTLIYNNSGNIDRGIEWSATSGVGYPHHVSISNGVTLNLGAGGPTIARQIGGNLTINVGGALSMATTPMTATLNVRGNLDVGGGFAGSLILSSSAGGNLIVGGNFTVNSASTFTHNNRSITLNGAANQNLSGLPTIYDLVLNNAMGATLSSGLTISNTLTLTTGTLTLGSNNLTLTNTAANAIGGTFSASAMVVTNGSGELIRAIATAGLPIAYTWPVGDNTSTTEYSPITINFTANNTARNVGFKTTDGVHPQMDNSPVQSDYLSRYWEVSNSAAGNYTYNLTATFIATDLVGSASNLRYNVYSGSAWLQHPNSSVTSNVLSATAGLTQTTGALTSGNAITGRVQNGQTYVWNQTGSANFNTSTNWTPNRVTAKTDDILVFNNGANTTSTNVPTQTIGQFLVSGNTSVTLTSTGNSTLTIAGNNGTDWSIASGSTVVLGTTGGNAITLAHTNSVVTSIAGTLQINANTANNNTVNFTNASGSVSGIINNAGVITSTTSNLFMASGAAYNHNFTATTGSIAIATWDPNATCRIQGYTNNSVPGNLNQTFGHFTWNCASQTGNTQLNGGLIDVAGNLTISSVGTGALYFGNNTTFTLNVGGNYAQSNNAIVELASGNGTYTASMLVTGNFGLTGTSSSFALHTGNNNSKGALSVGGNMTISTGCSLLQGVGGSTGNFVTWNGSSQQALNISGSLPSNQCHYRLNNNAGAVLTGTIPVNASSTFYRTAGTIAGGTITYNATSGSLAYEGANVMSTGIEFPATNGPVNVTMNATSIVHLTGARTIPSTGVFTNTSGVFALGSNDLTISNTAAGALTNAAPSATNMIAADGTGQLKLTLPNSARDLNFYIGDISGTNEYGGIRLNFSANSLNNRVVGVRLEDAPSTNLATPYAPIDYTTRHWVITLSNSGGTYSYRPTLTYDVNGDVEGTENNLQVAAFPSGASAWNHYTTNITSPNLAKAGGVLNQGDFSLNNAHFAGRTPVMYWTGAISSDWNTPGNWNTGVLPTAVDNVDINSAATNPCVLNSAATINHLTINQSGSFDMGSAANLTVAGNFTYVNSAVVNFNCASTLNITNTTFNQNIPAVQFGNLNLGTGTRTLANAGTIQVCGNYTPTSGSVISTGSSVEFNGTSAQSILSNATTFNHVTISNTSGMINSASNVAVNGTLNILAGARFNKSGATLTIASGANAQVNGFLRNAGTIATTGVLSINSGGVYEHNFTTSAGAVPTATWNTGSTCRFIGYTSNTTAPSGLSQSFHHVDWNCPSQTGNLNLAGGLTTINGDFSIASSGSGQLRLSGSASVTINVLGNFSQTGGFLNLKNGNNNQTNLIIGGDFVQTSGTFDGCAGNNGYAEVRLSGNYSRTGDGILTTSGTNTGNTLFLFNGINQSILHTSTGATSYCDFDIANGSTTSLLSNFALNTTGLTAYPVILDVLSGGTLDCSEFEISGVTGVLTQVRVNSGATIRTAHANGITASGLLGTVQTDNRTFNSGATYVYEGTTNQQTGNFWTATTTPNTVANLVLDNAASTVTLNAGVDVNVSNELIFTSTNTALLDAGVQTIRITNAATGAVIRSNSGHVIGNLSRAISPSATNTYTFHVGTSGTYAPVVSNLTTGSGAGFIVAKVTDGPHPQMATDGLSQTAICNRYWTITNAGTTVNAASHTFNYSNSDLLGGATSSTLSLARYASGWTYPTSTTATNAITGTGLNNTSSFGDFFAAANCTSYQANIASSGSTSFCAGGDVTLTASSNIPGSNFVWSPNDNLNSSTGASVLASPIISTTYTVTATSPQNCVDTETITVTVYPIPTATLQGPSLACEGSEVTIGFFGTPNAVASYQVNGGSVETVNLDGNGIGAVNFILTGNTTVELVEVNTITCAQVLNETLNIAVQLIDAQISGATTICGATSTDLVITGTANAQVTYAVNGGSNQTITLNGLGTYTLNSGIVFTNQTYQLMSVSNSTCSKALSQSATVIVNAIPDATFIGGGAVCGGSTQTIQVFGSANALVHYQVNGGSIQAITLNGSGTAVISTGTLNVNTTYHLISASIGSCTELIGVEWTYTIIGNTYYQDNDNDGFGNDAVSLIACVAPAGYVALPGDCNDSNPSLNPYTEWYGDMDGDGYGGFIYATQCADPNIPGVVAQGGDCNDNDPNVHGGLTEICNNGIDDNCNGQIDEGCVVLSNDSIGFAINIQNYTNSYPICSNYSGSTVGAKNSPESNGFIGKDRWYKFQAQTPFMRIACTTTTWDAAIQVCNQSFVPMAGASTNVQSGSGNEILVLSGLNIGQWYYISVGGVNGTETGQFNLCAQYFASSGCATNTASPLDICSTFKARYAGASNYTYTFAPLNPGMGGGVITAIGAITLSNPSLNLIPGQAYNVSVTATFANLVNGIGQQLPNIITQANGACVVAVAAHSDIQVRSSQRCSAPATLLRSSYMRTDPFVCGVTNYTFEFTPTSGCADYLGIGLPFTLVNSSRILQLNFNGSTTSPLGQTLQSQTYYIVRIRPNFSVNGSVQGSYGSPQIIFVGGSLMAMEDQIDGSNFDTYSDEADAFQVYPNPNFGDRLMVESGTGEGRLSLELFDQLGRSIEAIEIEADNGFYLEWVFKNQLSNGLYHVRLTNGQAIYQQKFMVTK